MTSNPQPLPPQRKPVYVFDTNLFVAALRSRRGASFVILNAVCQAAIATDSLLAVASLAPISERQPSHDLTATAFALARLHSLAGYRLCQLPDGRAQSALAYWPH